MNVKQRKGVGKQVQKKYLEVKRRQVKMDYLIRTKQRFCKNIQLCCTYTAVLHLYGVGLTSDKAEK
jgi:hypothetical protein